MGRMRWNAVWLLLVGLLVGGARGWAEDVDKLPAPTGYLSDLAGVIDEGNKAQMEALCTEVDQKAHAQIAVVTVHNLGGDSIEDFAVRLEEKWKVGAKGTDRGVLLLFAIDDHKDRIEVGYGLEGLLNDAKVGDILRSVRPELQQGQDGQAIFDALKQVSNDIAADAHVTLDQGGEAVQYHVQHVRRANNGIGAVIRVIFFIIVLIVIFGSGRRGGRGGGGSGLGWFLLGNFLGSQGGRRDDGWGGGGGGWGGGGGDGGGFGGFGGGSSGGGGASGDW